MIELMGNMSTKSELLVIMAAGFFQLANQIVGHESGLKHSQ